MYRELYQRQARRLIPSSKYLRMNDIRMRMALKLFLDLPIIPPDDGVCIVCKEHFDGTFAEHMLRCKCKGIRNNRHNAIRDDAFEMFRQTVFSVSKEVNDFIAKTQMRPADILAYLFGSHGQDMR